MDEKILRLPVVKDRTGLSRSSIYEKIAARRFPKPISLGARAVGWLESDIEAWIASRIPRATRSGSPERESGSPVGSSGD